jgi:hypothetical protein
MKQKKTFHHDDVEFSSQQYFSADYTISFFPSSRRKTFPSRQNYRLFPHIISSNNLIICSVFPFSLFAFPLLTQILKEIANGTSSRDKRRKREASQKESETFPLKFIRKQFGAAGKLLRNACCQINYLKPTSTTKNQKK